MAKQIVGSFYAKMVYIVSEPMRIVEMVPTWKFKAPWAAFFQ
jgi:hypothetical protein